MSTDECLCSAIQSAVAADDVAALEEALLQATDHVLRAGSVSHALSACLLGMLASKPFLQSRGSRYVLHFVESQWDDLDVQQQEQLISALQAAYPLFADWMACFVVTEILGTKCDPTRALSVLERLRSSTRATWRSCIPHGLEHLALRRPDSEVSRAATAALEEMLADPSEEVRQEARHALERVRRRASG